MKGVKYSIYLGEDEEMLKKEMQQEGEKNSEFFQRMIHTVADYHGIRIIQAEKHIVRDYD